MILVAVSKESNESKKLFRKVFFKYIINRLDKMKVMKRTDREHRKRFLSRFLKKYH
jgi:hypothetical protein